VTPVAVTSVVDPLYVTEQVGESTTLPTGMRMVNLSVDPDTVPVADPGGKGGREVTVVPVTEPVTFRPSCVSRKVSCCACRCESYALPNQFPVRVTFSGRPKAVGVVT